jgi:GH43 family beta-xylosidase
MELNSVLSHLKFHLMKFSILFSLCMALFHGNLLSQQGNNPSENNTCTFKNPIASGDSPDPQVIYKDGYYYGCHTTGGDVRIYKSKTLQDIFHSRSASIWGGKHDVWAPEIHYLNGKWYIYTSYNMDSLWLNIVVLEGTSQDALGSYTEKASLTAIGPAIDPSIWQDSANNQIYIAYSRFVKNGQEIWMSKMSNPYTLQGNPVRLSYPEYGWEKQSGNVNEGPAFLKHGSLLHIVYSASQCHYENYCLGMLTANSGSNYMDTTSWSKSAQPVFQKCPANNVYAVGHHCCIRTPGGEWWLIYHGKYESNRNGQAPRDARMQQFTFKGDMPVFGIPVKTNEPIACPDNYPGKK